MRSSAIGRTALERNICRLRRAAHILLLLHLGLSVSNIALEESNKMSGNKREREREEKSQF